MRTTPTAGTWAKRRRPRARVGCRALAEASSTAVPPPLAPSPLHLHTEPATPADVRLVVEVADTSLTYDRTVKLPMYARSGVREAWLVDLSRDRVEIHQEPGSDGYRRVEIQERGGRLVPGAFPDLSLTVD